MTKRVSDLLADLPRTHLETPPDHPEFEPPELAGAVSARSRSPLHRDREIGGVPKVILVEGVANAESLRRFGVVATTWAGTSKDLSRTDWEPLGGKTVCLWPTNNPPGIDVMEKAASILLDLDSPPVVKWIEPGTIGIDLGVGPAEFINDLSGIEESEKKDEVWKVLASATAYGVATDLQNHLERTIRGELTAVHFPFPCLSFYTNALLPGNILVLAGGPGVSKSLFLIQCLAHWYEIGIPVAGFLLEGDERFHMLRVLAQRSGKPGLTDPGWIGANPEETRTVVEEHRGFIEGFAHCLTSGINRTTDHDSVLRWVENSAHAGARIIAVDPVTLVEQKKGLDYWDAHRDFIKGIQGICRTYACSFIAVTHPVKQWDKPSLNNLAGGTAYSRFSDSVFWVSCSDEYFTISGNAGDLPTHVDRVVSVLKCRNGKGSNLGIGFRWDSDSLSFIELGPIVKKSKAHQGTEG